MEKFMGSDENLAKELPVIHFNNESLTPGSSSWVSTSQMIRSALESGGCFVAVCETLVSLEMHQKLFDLSKDLFELPVEIKEKNISEYLGFGFGSNFGPHMPLTEYLGITYGATHEAVKDFTNLMWPHGNDQFRETAYSYTRQLLELMNVVMTMSLESYGAAKYYDLLDQSAFHLTRFIKYRTPNEGEINVGIAPHVDKTFLSILDTNHVAGLELESKDGEWIGFKPSPSAFLILAGEAFTALSNGRVYAPLHRVIIEGAEEKYTIGLFSFMHGTLEIPEEFVDEEHPLQFRPFNNVAYLSFCGGRNVKARRAIKDFCGI